MTTPVITVSADTPVGEIAAVLRENRISAVPVLDATGGVVGLVSEHDLLARAGEVARDVMTSSVISVTEDTDVDDVRHLLVDRRIRRVPAMPRRVRPVHHARPGTRALGRPGHENAAGIRYKEGSAWPIPGGAQRARARLVPGASPTKTRRCCAATTGR